MGKGNERYFTLSVFVVVVGQGSLEEEMSETDMVEEELKRMELEQYNDVL